MKKIKKNVAICINSTSDKDGRQYYVIIAELSYKEYLVRKNELKEELGGCDWWTIGGYELGFLYPF